MPSQAPIFKFPTSSNNKMADQCVCETEATLAPVNSQTEIKYVNRYS